MKNERGMSLIELLVAMVILGIVLAGVTTYIADQVKTVRQQEMLANTQQNLRAAMDLITRDLRSAEYDVTNNPTTSPFREFQTATDTQVIFYTDINGNGAINNITTRSDSNEVKGYLKRSAQDSIYIQVRDAAPKTWEAVAGNIQTLRFTYYDINDDSMAFPIQGQRLRDIFKVRVAIQARTPRRWSTSVDTLRRQLIGVVQIRSRQGI
jgi:type IV pilus assembly protein PilW